MNVAQGNLDPALGEAIAAAAAEVAAGKWDDDFPLVVWQTGSGTQSNMNANEVISNRAIEMLGGEHRLEEAGAPERPRQHGPDLERHLPDGDARRGGDDRARRDAARACSKLHGALADKAEAFKDIIKIGRTHTQDATPLTLGQEFGGYAFQVEQGIKRVTAALHNIYPLAQGGTAVGTGLNTQQGLRREDRRQDRRDHRPAVRHRAEQVRGAGRATTRWSRCPGR